ncbi:DUF4197 domain-containing protein [Leptospira sp. 96542]|nr:DUF4197 domain-containing protein [Leptospira sp. 96542]
MKHAVWIVVALLMGCSSAQIDQAVKETKKLAAAEKPLTAAEVGRGLKDALVQGVGRGVDLLSQTDGYFGNAEVRIPFPADLKKLEDTLRKVGLGDEVDRFVRTLNRGAEEAAKEARPIFVAAITSMTIEDAWGILRGDDNAATAYLQKTTTPQLTQKFRPIMQKALDKTSATQYFGDLVKRYNQIPLVQKINPDLNAYATDRAIQGLFVQIAKEEKNIRQNPVARTTDLLKRVFGSKK